MKTILNFIKKNRNIILLIISFVFLTMLILGMTYAYFDLKTGGETESTMNIGGAEISATYAYSNSINITDALPGNDIIAYKDITLTYKNTSSEEYKVYLKTVIDYSTFTNTENDGVLYYDIYSGTDHSTLVQDKTIFPTITYGKAILKEISIPANSTGTLNYRINFYFPESDKLQNPDGQLVLNASISLDSDNALDYDNTDINVTIYDPIANTNTTIIGEKGKNIILPTAKVYENCEFSNYEIKDGIGKINGNTINALTDVTVRINYTYTIDFDFITYDYIAPTTDVAEPYYTYEVPADGIYNLEVWGAQGGFGKINGNRGGFGAYSTGKIVLKKGNKLYIYVGGIGETSSKKENNVKGKAGYNGGGAGMSTTGKYGSGGGGATHIAFKVGQLKTLENSKEDIIIISGGGGAGFNHGSDSLSTIGGSAGGYMGTGSNPGTQTSGGGSFGLGQTSTGGGSGGGGGLYGGALCYDNIRCGGGSSYINSIHLIKNSRYMFCYECPESTVESTKTISTTCHSATPTPNCAKEGNGYAKITLIK